ncbi:MBL fold metallo-hydrolase [Candidatus Woesearchaeota archaeon]|nr:MBL fold metallo-hydrolase [Candidatus Woesearchaeota archaeon]
MILEDEFGDIIKKARNGLKISLNDLALKTGINEKDISLMESYKLRPTKEQITKLSKFLGLNGKKLINIFNWEPKKSKLESNSIKVIKMENDYHGYLVNSYIVIKGINALLIDTGANPQNASHKLKELNIKLNGILLTHGHGDHTYGAEEISKRFNCEVFRDFDYDKDLKIKNFHVKVISTPGHTSKSCSYLIDNFLFVGDELFAGSIGNSEIPYEKHLEIIRKKILSLDDDVILPGHGPVTTVKEEKENNPFF